MLETAAVELFTLAILFIIITWQCYSAYYDIPNSIAVIPTNNGPIN